MWDFVQVTVVVTLVLEIRFGILRASAGWICSVDYGVNSSPPSSRSKRPLVAGYLGVQQGLRCLTRRPGLCPWALGARPWQGKNLRPLVKLAWGSALGPLEWLKFGLPSLSVELGHMTLFLDQRRAGGFSAPRPLAKTLEWVGTWPWGYLLGLGKSLAVWQGPLKGKFVRESGPGAMQSARLGSSLAFKGFGKDGGLSLYNPCVRQGKLRETPISFGLLILESMVRQGCQFLVREQSVCWGPWRQKLGLPRVELGSELILGRERLELGLA
ncbi:unnamed protein product [Prunus armeniaca]